MFKFQFNFKLNLKSLVYMKTISVLEFRKNARQIIRLAINGQRMTMTYRGKPVFRIEPIKEKKASADDPFYRLAEMAESKGESLSNDQIDAIIYGTKNIC
jgi:antitoxin (DNA-binding transcriptional repressor) of toxin-antitoxin stability system